MASIIRIKRSSGTGKPGTLQWGELAYVTGIGSYGGLNQYKDRIFLGDDGTNVNPIGGYYYASMMEHSPGAIAGVTNTRNSDGGIVVILDSSRKVDQWNVDNLRLDGNTFSSQNTDGDIVLDPNGTGEINIVDDTYLSFGNDKDVKLRYDEATDNRFEIEGADWNFANNVAISISDTTASTTPTTGALTVTGGVGFATHLNVGGNVDIDLDLNVDGGDITTNLTAFNILNATATNINAFGAATALVIGATTGITTIRNATVDLDGDLNVDGGDITTNLTAFNILNATATNINAFGAATALVVGATSGIATINNPTVVGTQATQNLYNTVATNLNFAGAATALDIGATTGIATIRNATLSVPNATTLNLGATSSATSVNFQSTPNTSFVAIAATTNATTTTSGALRVAGGVGIEKDVHIGGTLTVAGAQTLNNNLTVTGNLQVDGNTTLGNASTDTITITGVLNHTGPLTNTGGVTIDNIGISSNVISTKSGGGNVLYIDPYPDGLSNEGLVVVKGNLQVDGTTTTVDSSSVTVNGSIISLGDVTSNRTVIATVASGVSTITLDSVVGINTGDIISGNAALPNSGLTTITAYNTATKIITITGVTGSGITSTTQLTITHAYDTNTDRGISFDYNTGVGTANQKSGFFGFDDSTGYFTYVPDANISNSVVTGTRGYLDIKGIYYQSGDFSTHGVVYFDNTGLQNSTNDPASPTITSKQILTAVTEANITLSGLATVTAGDIILQSTGGAYGVVKTSVASTTIVTLIGVEGTFNTTNNSILLKNGSNIGIGTTAIVASVVYTNKPMWTSTLDGGTF
jgi:hypothetical protein